MRFLRGLGGVAALAAAALLWGCDRGDASAPARDHSGASVASAGGARYDGSKPHAPAPMLNGKPIWADNRAHSAEENIAYQFDHWGSTVSAKDAKDYARKARAFIDHPPAKAETVKRPNGDVMIYDKASNTFAIVRKDGAPRLFRKPPDGEAAWAKAKSEAASPSSYRSRGRYNAPSASEFGRGGDG